MGLKEMVRASDLGSGSNPLPPLPPGMGCAALLAKALVTLDKRRPLGLLERRSDLLALVLGDEAGQEEKR